MGMLLKFLDLREPYWMGLLAIPVIIIFMIKSQKFALYIIIIVVYLLEWLNTSFYLIPRSVIWMKNIAMLILFFRVLFLISLNRQAIKTPIDLTVISLLMVSIISFIGNGASLIPAFLGFRRHFTYILFFYLISYLDFDESYLKKIVSLIVLIALVQIPVSIAEFILWKPEIISGPASGHFDFITGTFPRGSSGYLSLFLLAVVCICLGFGAVRQKVRMLGLELKPVILAALLLVPLPFTQSRATFLFLPLVIGFTVFRRISLDWRKKLWRRRLITGYSIFFVVIILLGSRVTGYDIGDYILNPKKALNEQLDTSKSQSGAEIGRIASLQLIYELQRNNWFNLIFGSGAGSWSKSYFNEYSGNLWKLYKDQYVSERSQIAFSLSEFGFLGCTIFLILLYKMFKMNEAFLNNSRDDYWRAVSYGFRGIIFLTFLASFYVTILDGDSYVFMLMTLGGIINKVQNG